MVKRKPNNNRTKFVLWIVFFVCFVSFGISDAENEQVTGRLRGTVKNVTSNKIVPQQKVTLYAYRNDAEIDNRSAISDSTGAFEFSQLEIAPSLSYRLTTRFHNVDYSVPFIRLTSERPEQTVDVKVYFSSDDESNIQITAHHIVLHPIESGCQITEYIILENTGNTSYLTTSSEGNEIGLRLELPHGFEHLKPMQGLMECCISLDGNTLLYSHAILPGVKKTIVFTYHMSSPSKRNKSSLNINLSRSLSLNTNKLLVLVAEEAYHLTSSILNVSDKVQMSGGESGLQGKTYKTYIANDLTKGQKVDMRLELPHKRRFNPIWLSGIVLVVGLVSILVIRRLSTTRRIDNAEDSTSSVSPVRTELEDLKSGYLELISKLDEMYESGEISETAYKKIREEQKVKLGELITKERRNQS